MNGRQNIVRFESHSLRQFLPKFQRVFNLFDRAKRAMTVPRPYHETTLLTGNGPMGRLDQEFQFYLDNQDAMVEKYDGKVIAVKGGKVLGVYDSYLDA